MRLIPKIISVLIFGLFLFNIHASGQEIIEISADEIPGYKLDRNESFNGGSLWGYMNGGADIYLEYGFENLRVEEFSFEGETIKLELFKMEDPIAAFGIYSIKTFRCEHSKVISSIDCLNRFQFQLVYGNYYIQLINDSGTEKAKESMISIAETLLNKIDPEELKLPLSYLTDSLNFPLSDITMVKGMLGVQDKAMWIADYLEDIDNYQIYYAKKEIGGEIIKYYEIVFDSPEIKNQFLATNKDRDLLIIKEDKSSMLIRQ